VKRVTDCFRAPVIIEARLILVAMTAGRLSKLTIKEASDLCDMSIGQVSMAFSSLKAARIDTARDNNECVLSSEWNPLAVNGETRADQGK
jgi:hypothetical protein